MRRYLNVIFIHIKSINVLLKFPNCIRGCKTTFYHAVSFLRTRWPLQAQISSWVLYKLIIPQYILLSHKSCTILNSPTHKLMHLQHPASIHSLVSYLLKAALRSQRIHHCAVRTMWVTGCHFHFITGFISFR